MQGVENQGSLNQIEQVATNLAENYSDLSSQGQEFVTGVARNFSEEVLEKFGLNKSETASLDWDNLQESLSAGSETLGSGSVSKNEISNTVNQAAEIVSSSEVQKQFKNKIKDNLSFFKEQLTEFDKLSNKDKSLFGLGTFGVAIGAPIAIAALPILATVAAIAGFAIAIIGGLKLATPSKAEFKQSWQEVKEDVAHNIKNLANKAPVETNLEKLWKSAHKPGVTTENPNLKEFLTKYCFPDQESGKKVKVKFDSDKIEALKVVAEEIGLNLDIDRMVRKGESKIRGDFVQNSQAQGEGDNKFIGTANEIATKVMAKDYLIEDKFKDKLAEVRSGKELKNAIKEVDKEAKKVDKMVGQDGLFTNLFSKKPSHTKNVEAERREGNNSLSKG